MVNVGGGRFQAFPRFFELRRSLPGVFFLVVLGIVFVMSAQLCLYVCAGDNNRANAIQMRLPCAFTEFFCSRREWDSNPR